MVLSKRKILLSALSVCVAISIIYILLPQNTKKTVRRAIKRPYLILTGRLVDVGGYRLRIECQGSGNPTIVMDAGINKGINTWKDIPKEVAKFTRVCVYERAGVGESDAPPKQLRTSKNVVSEIHTLLQNAGEKTPFVLVGHSLGGLNMRLYSSLFPPDVVGLVLIDSSHPEQYQRYANLLNAEEREKYLRHEGGENAESLNILASAEEVKATPSIPPMPLIVLSAESENPDAEDILYMKDNQEMRDDLVRLSPKGRLIIVKGSHFIQEEHPDVVIEALKSIYETSKKPD